jgi:hypothetical protein
VEEIQEYQTKWQNHVQRMPPERLLWQTYSYHPIGRRTLGVQEGDGDNNSFSLRMGQWTQSLNGKKKKKMTFSYHRTIF